MNLLDDDRALTHRGGDSLDGALPHVPDGEDAGQARLERKRRRVMRRVGEVAARRHESPLVTLDGGRKPVGVWACPDEDEQSRGGTVDSEPDPVSRSVSRSSLPSPPPPTTSVCNRTSTFGAAASVSIR